MAENPDDDRRRRVLFIPILTLVICVSGLFAISYTLLITDVMDDFTVVTDEDVRLNLVDRDNNVLDKVGGFSKGANKGEGATKIFYTGACIDGNHERYSYNIGKQFLELGRANLDISVRDNLVNHVRVWYEIDWSAGLNPVEEYGLNLRLNIDELGTSLSEGEYSEFIDISEVCKYEFVLTGEIDEFISSKQRPESMVYTITIHVESY